MYRPWGRFTLIYANDMSLAKLGERDARSNGFADQRSNGLKRLSDATHAVMRECVGYFCHCADPLLETQPVTFAAIGSDTATTPMPTAEGPAIGQERQRGEVTDRRRALLADALFRTGAEDREAFREVYTLTSAKLFGICLLICGNRQGAEDVLQDVYLKVWRRAGAWEPGRGSAIAWLAAIARNASIDWRRNQTARPARPLEDAPDIPDTAPCAETRLLSAEMSKSLTKCLGALDPRAREAIGAAFFHGLTYTELAERDGVPLGTMKSVIRRGLARLKHQVEMTDLLPNRRSSL